MRQPLQLLKQFISRLWRIVPPGFHWRLLWFLQPKFNIGVTGIITNKDRKILLLKHVLRRQYCWGLPSGWMKQNETVEAALQREVLEETGISLTDCQICQINSGFKLRLEFVFMAQSDAAEIKNLGLEIFEAAFVPPDELPDQLLPSHREYIHKYLLKKRDTNTAPCGGSRR